MATQKKDTQQLSSFQLEMWNTSLALMHFAVIAYFVSTLLV